MVQKKPVGRPKGKQFEEKCTMPTVKHPTCQMIWGAMSVNGTAALYFLPAEVTMNGSRYVNLLREKLQLHMAVHHCSVFMHDGASCHRSKMVQSFLDQQRINMLEWPGNSPDLNPIENWLSTTKRKVAE